MRAELEEFYREKDPVKRREMLGALMKEDDGQNADVRLAGRLFALRYGTDDNTDIDYFIRSMLTLMSISRAPSFFTGHQKRQVEKIIRELGITEAEERIAAGELTRDEAEEILYAEFQSAAATYVDTCSDGEYHRLLGLAAATDNGRKTAMQKDIADMGRTIADRFHMEEPLRVWCQALEDAADI